MFFLATIATIWKAVKGYDARPGSVSGPHLFNTFLNDLEIVHNGLPAFFIISLDTSFGQNVDSVPQYYSVLRIVQLYYESSVVRFFHITQ